MAQYEVYISANINSPDGMSRFSLVENQKIELTTFAELDELMARVRKAIHPEEKE